MCLEGVTSIILKGRAQCAFRDLVGWYTGITHGIFIRDRDSIKHQENGKEIIEKYLTLLEGLYRIMHELYKSEAVLQPDDVMVILEVFRTAGLHYIKEKHISLQEADSLFSTYHMLAQWEEKYEAAHPIKLPFDLQARAQPKQFQEQNTASKFRFLNFRVIFQKVYI